MGRVIVAQHRSAGAVRRLVALKTVHEHLLEDATFLRLFHREADVASRLHHPNVVPVLELDECESGPFIVMELFASVPFSSVLRGASRERERLDCDVVAAMVADACAGAHAAHELKDERGALLNIVHRDLTPSNLLVGAGAIVRVADFGVARAQSAAIDDVTVSPDEIRGKLGYLSPEQVLGERLDRRSDVFTLGVVLWEALCGQRLFPRRDSEAATMRAILEGEIDPIRAHREDCPESLERVVARALERDRERRFRTADELRAALLACTDGATVERRAALARRFVDAEVQALEARIDEASQAVGRGVLSPDTSGAARSGVRPAQQPSVAAVEPRRSAPGRGVALVLVLVGAVGLVTAAALIAARREPERTQQSAVVIAGVDASADVFEVDAVVEDQAESVAVDAGATRARVRRATRSKRLPLF